MKRNLSNHRREKQKREKFLVMLYGAKKMNIGKEIMEGLNPDISIVFRIKKRKFIDQLLRRDLSLKQILRKNGTVSSHH
jgi:hypothetical protein